MKRILLSGCIAAVLASCGGQKVEEDYSYNAPQFPNTEEVTITPITVDEIMPNHPGFLVHDTIAYVVARMNEKWIHAFSLNSGKPLGSYIPVGNGPGEIYNPFNAQINRKNGVITIQQGSTFFHYSTGKDGEVVWIDSKDIPPLGIKDGLVLATDKKDGPKIVTSNNVHELPQPGRLLAEDIDPNNLNLMVKKIITDTVAGPAYQNLNGDPGEVRIMNRSGANCAISPDGKRAVFMPSVGGIVQVLDISSDEIKPIKTMRYFPQEFNEVEGNLYMKPPFTLGFISVAADDNYFYAAYSGEKVDKVVGQTVNHIGVWDWKGNPVKSYTTDKGITSIALSDDGNTLYVATYDDDESSQLGKIPLR